jgi:hypothetical protein
MEMAVAVVVCDDQESKELTVMRTDSNTDAITIPSVFISLKDGVRLKGLVKGGAVATVKIDWTLPPSAIAKTATWELW